MRGLKIYLADGTYEGTVTMSSDSSKISVIKVKKENIKDYENELNGPGIYLLLVASEAVYVGQTGLDTIQRRILNTHSGDIDSSWHTVLGCKFADPNISSNELQFIENAMCEYAHKYFKKCLTTSPTKVNCTRAFRKRHYHLNGGQIHTCENYIQDIEFYLDVFPNGIFGYTHSKSDIEILHLASRQVAATAYIAGNRFVVCKGSSFSAVERPSCPNSIYNRRRMLISENKIKNGCFVEDVAFDSPSTAAACIVGGSANGRIMWLYPDGQSIKDRESHES
ncbi:DUF4357 domain-containing protein [Megasphaera sp. DISK 18]|uniref:DUF4357 domain-containing protein n=1 Tax=Megasphaera sp. DISK 18 TaxID=1776081 RepID=UPI0008070A10|nr:DUF4357 domain-containing protein [Megasphaera sp. DISK 18]OBZ32363.1 hypothetical protein A0U42_11030 [Megasphaera sp. DISK 18]